MTHSKKIITLILFVILTAKVKSQTAIPYKTIISGGQYSSDGSPWQSPQVYKKTATQLEVDNFIFGTAAKVDLLASDYIRIKPTTRAGTFFSNDPNWKPYFHAGIDQNMLNIASYHPNGFVNIPRYDKFELGIKLPDDLTKRVDDFFGEYEAAAGGGHNGYGCKFRQAPQYPNNINPYDPDQISVEATFSFPNKPSQIIYGFYYREYTYTGAYGNNPNFSNMNWEENLNLLYHWRVRFAPKYIGVYTITWKVKINNVVILEDNIGHVFTTTTSDNPGFVKIGSQGKFLVTQPDPSDPQKTILPIGLVEAAGTVSQPHPPEEQIPFGEASVYEDYNIQFPSRYWRDRNTIRTKIAEKGGNFTRLFVAPWNYEIEWENKGIYDARQNRPLQEGITSYAGFATPIGAPNATMYKGTNRQAILWELDSVFDMAQANNLYIQLVLSPNHLNPPQWPPAQILMPFVDTYDFFTNSTEIHEYEKRLRYFYSRYGYATSLVAVELLNEIQHLKTIQGTPNVTVKNWLEEILNYTKGSSNLNHNDHLCTVSYELGYDGDDIGNLPKIDFMSSHPYNYHKDYSFGSVKYERDAFVNTYNKPYQAGEMGLSPNPPGNMFFAELMGPTFHTLLWSTTFMGGITSGLDMWGDAGLRINPTIPQWPRECAGNFVEHFLPLQNFIQNTNFDEKNYIPKEYHDQDNKIETFYLIENNGINADNAIGYVRNKSFWWSNLGLTEPEINAYLNVVYSDDCSNCISYDQPVLNGNLGQIYIQGLKWNSPYIVEWYDTYNGSLINSQIFTSFGDTKFLTPPSFGGTCFNHEYGFKIKSLPARSISDSDSTKFKVQSVDLANLDNPSKHDAKKEFEFGSKNVKIYPNPSSDKLYLKFDRSEFKDYTIELFDLSGRLILKQNNTTELSTSQIENGAYMLKFFSGDFVKTFKINILH